MTQDCYDPGEVFELPDDLRDDPDVKLITCFLTKQLAPESRREVKRRLEKDEAFWELAVPLIAAWCRSPNWRPGGKPIWPAQVAKDFDRLAWGGGAVSTDWNIE
jgi:hypothetical protein